MWNKYFISLVIRNEFSRGSYISKSTFPFTLKFLVGQRFKHLSSRFNLFNSGSRGLNWLINELANMSSLVGHCDVYSLLEVKSS